MDSWLIKKLWEPDVSLYVDIYGTYSTQEKMRLPSDTEIVGFSFLGTVEQADAYVPLRNLYFLMLASHYGNDICLGATAGDGGADKSEAFLVETEQTLQRLWHDKKCYKDISIEKRFVKMDKGELLEAYLEKGGTVQEVKEQTFSCYTPMGGKECFNCYPCFRKYAILKSHGASYTHEEEERLWEYVRREVIPTREEGGYTGTYYTDRGKESQYLIHAVDYLRETYGQ